MHLRICENKHFMNVLILLQNNHREKKYPLIKEQLFLVVYHAGLPGVRTLWENSDLIPSGWSPNP